MHANELETPVQTVIYPDSDGKPMADNTLQYRWIVTIVGNLEDLYADDPNVFIAGDLLWYPVEGNNKIRSAPDALVAFGRPKGDRGSYKQWEEGGIAPQVVFEVLSPGNTRREMDEKLAFYDRYGVEEYYLYDPDRGRLQGWWRQQGRLVEITPMRGWVSPRLGVRFDLDGLELCLTRPDGERFAPFLEVFQQARDARQHAVAEFMARQAAEQRAEAEAAARREADQRAEAEAAARREADQRATNAQQQVATEAAARREAEQRAAAAEAELVRLRALLESQAGGRSD